MGVIDVIPRGQISDEERALRQDEVDEARASVRFEGGILAPEIEEINRRYIIGELTSDEHVAAVESFVLQQRG